ncbi:hypothetical protein SteCoe_23227 [Stentor coeruleus]|uniref:J domain-containing protein n=1 Tax=Stentor coeruleus TaxID=5963 RepID=A0A1R2BKC8_9CILI|nr:hypothetical protein SteCoe_23227 [Stentor coeruleus]
MSQKNHYNILSVPQNFTEKELKVAYHKLALKWHPDKNLNNKLYAEEKFKDICKAYGVLSNPQKKMMYDLFGNCEDEVIEGHSTNCDEQSVADFILKYEDLNEGYKKSVNGSGVGRKRSRSRRNFNQELTKLLDDFFPENPREYTEKVSGAKS